MKTILAIRLQKIQVFGLAWPKHLAIYLSATVRNNIITIYMYTHFVIYTYTVFCCLLVAVFAPMNKVGPIPA